MRTTAILLGSLLIVSQLDAQSAGRGRNVPASPTTLTPGIGAGGRAAVVPRQQLAAPNAFAQHLFSPELVMQNQQGIELLDEQRSVIVRETAQAQVKFTELQWTLSAEEQKLGKLLQAPAPDENAVLASMDRILAVEHDIKRTQLTMLVRVKSVLNPAQQEYLSRMQSRPSMPQELMGGAGGGSFGRGGRGRGPGGG
jgi:hypothetical protein